MAFFWRLNVDRLRRLKVGRGKVFNAIANEHVPKVLEKTEYFIGKIQKKQRFDEEKMTKYWQRGTRIKHFSNKNNKKMTNS